MESKAGGCGIEPSVGGENVPNLLSMDEESMVDGIG